MRRYVALLRGVSPISLKMPALKRCFEAAGFGDVQTVLASGNVLFSAPAGSESALARKVERALKKALGRSFLTLVRSLDSLNELLDADPFARYKLPAGAKRVVTFLPKAPAGKVKLPEAVDGARIYAVRGSEALTAYVRNPRGPVFMTLIQKTFGDDVTTRTWDTVKKLAADRPAANSGERPAARKKAKKKKASSRKPGLSS